MLHEIKEYCDEATDGPWAWSDRGNLVQLPSETCWEVRDISMLLGTGQWSVPRKDKRFIERARTDLPIAVDALQEIKDLHQPDNSHMKHMDSESGNMYQSPCIECGKAYPCPSVMIVEKAWRKNNG